MVIPVRARTALVIITMIAGIVACRHDALEDLVPSSVPGSVNVDPSTVPYATLSEYGLFQGALASLDPHPEVLPYDVITPLFSDYAKKARFVWMPSGSRASYTGDHEVLAFPERSVLIKTFYYDNVQPGDGRKILETRLLIRANGEWVSATYVWNAEQTEAYLDMTGSNVPITWMDEQDQMRNVTYRIPAGAECFTCHKQGGVTIPIGPKPRNLDRVFNYGEGEVGQLEKWVQHGYLEPGYPASIDRVTAWDDESEDLSDRVRSYLDMNCAHCHAEQRHCDYRPMRFAWELTADPVNLGLCVEPDEQILPFDAYIVSAGNVDKSMMHYRISSTEVSERMPLLGRTLVHQEAVDMIADWILQLSPPCN